MSQCGQKRTGLAMSSMTKMHDTWHKNKVMQKWQN